MLREHAVSHGEEPIGGTDGLPREDCGGFLSSGLSRKSCRDHLGRRSAHATSDPSRRRSPKAGVLRHDYRQPAQQRGRIDPCHALAEPGDVPASKATVKLPAIFKVDQFGTAKLKDELNKENGVRLELPVRESVKAFARLQQILKSQGVNLVIEQAAQFRSKYPKLKTNFVLFLEENITADEARGLFARQLGVEEAKGDKKKAPSQFEALVVTELSKEDVKELAYLEDRRSSTATRQREQHALGTHLKKPLSDMTADQVSQAIKNNSMRRKPGAKMPDHQALVLPYNPGPSTSELSGSQTVLREPQADQAQHPSGFAFCALLESRLDISSCARG